MFTPSNKTSVSMWRLLTVLVTLAVLLIVVAARHSGLVAVAAQQVTTIMPRNLQPVPDRQLSTGERLTHRHKALQSPGDPHDVILEVGAIGGATSVPSVIEELAKLGTVPREGPYGAIDTRFHVLNTLQSITNHDAGRNAEDWRAWYEKNKDKTQAQWIKDGLGELLLSGSGQQGQPGGGVAYPPTATPVAVCQAQSVWAGHGAVSRCYPA